MEIFIGVDIRVIDLVVMGIFSCLCLKDKIIIVFLILVEMYKGFFDCVCGIINILFFMDYVLFCNCGCYVI